mmetsp:Transcript_9954/g.21906  ORF Transcript_9954/g.21906 Transcript_9954/m.21906 type:complete len:116 (-) Transcript_9954:6-353(-)
MTLLEMFQVQLLLRLCERLVGPIMSTLMKCSQLFLQGTQGVERRMQLGLWRKWTLTGMDCLLTCCTQSSVSVKASWSGLAKSVNTSSDEAELLPGNGRRHLVLVSLFFAGVPLPF